ncbi:hypothetical protein HDA40_003543 [Hamadaea flava]|uniref:DUF397 domain-containing protein n=1 Tax=Hamadaea flava TaxID=1742688 RepID=A0ABV8LJX7_9ACTN|nr:DUF397 domain-containing protein [Hamadaea flava]MCP2325036.1 hypothetical protein [Hamadaea flava]
MVELRAAVWRRSTKCESGSCVEVADLDENVGLRNSTRPEIAIAFSVETWRDFIAGVRAGEFDQPSA